MTYLSNFILKKQFWTFWIHQIFITACVWHAFRLIKTHQRCSSQQLKSQNVLEYEEQNDRSKNIVITIIFRNIKNFAEKEYSRVLKFSIDDKINIFVGIMNTKMQTMGLIVIKKDQTSYLHIFKNIMNWNRRDMG